MKSSPTSPYPKTGLRQAGSRHRDNAASSTAGAGFTIIEVLSAITVLSIILVMLGQILGLADQAWMSGRGNVNNFTKARAMLDMFASDIQAGVFRNDVPAFPSSNIEFFTKRPGIPGATGSLRNVSLVQYAYASSSSSITTLTTLDRGDMAIYWGSAASNIAFSNSAGLASLSSSITLRDTATGVIDYKVLFIYADGTMSTTYPSASASPLRELSLALAVVDDLTLQQMNTNEITGTTGLRTKLDAAVTTADIKSTWETLLSGNTITWSAYPKSTASSLKVFERYVSVSGF